MVEMTAATMAIAIAEVAATGEDLRTDEAQNKIVARWCEWARSATDVGNLTRTVLGAAGRHRGTAAAALRASRDLHERTGHTAGNGSLMRTAPVTLAYLHDEDGLVEAAAAISALTHFDPEAGQACVLWCLAIRHAVLAGELDRRRGLSRLPAERRTAWSRRIDVAESSRPADFRRNGWAVEALQGAWSAIATTPVPHDDPSTGVFRADHLRLALEAAVRGGRDPDTVAAIAGGLLGAAYGASAVPAQWRRILHGWPGTNARGLVELASSILRGKGDDFDRSYPAAPGSAALAQHPYDDHVWLGGIGALRALPDGVDAVVSLCRVGDDDLPKKAELVEVRLIDKSATEQNRNLGFVLHDTVSVIERLRREGRTVLVHCVQAQGRTPTIAALYGMRRNGTSADTALAAIQAVLPSAHPNDHFRAALRAAQR